MTNKIVILDNSIELYEHYVDDARWERTLAFPRGGVTYLVSNGTIKFYAFEDYLYRNCLISMQLPIRVLDEKRNIDGEYEDIDDLTRVLDPIFPSNDIDAELEYYLSIADAERTYQPIGDYALKSEIPSVDGFVTDEELVDALDDYVEKEGFNSYTAETAAVIEELDNRKADKSELSPYFDGASYDEESKQIKFYHNGEIKAQIDARPFIKDGMVSNVRLENSYLIITFNTDAGKKPIAIKIESIFDPSNYYTKAEIGDKFQPIGNYVSASTYTAFTSTTNASINNLRTTKLDASAYTPSDLSNYYTKDEVYSKSETYNRNEIGDNFQPKGNYVSASTYTAFTSTTNASIETLRGTKLDISAYTPSDLSNYYTKAEIGDNFQPIGNYVSASTYTSFTSTTEASIDKLRGTKLDVSAYTPSDLSNYYTKSEVYSKSETYNRNEIDDKITQSGTFDPTQYYTKGQCDTRFALKNEMPSLDGYASEEWVTSKNYSTRADFITYINNMQQQINSLMGAVSGCCQTHEDVYRWLTIIGEYLCQGNDKYEKQKYQVSHDGGIVWQDVTPVQYQKGQLIESNSKDCGYAPQPQYRWQKADTSDYMCSGTSKYYKLYYQVSNDGGQTWQNAVPEQTKIGDLIESNSSDCGYVTPQYRWKKAPSTDYVCSGTTKYYKEYYQVSYDGGKTWSNVSPEQTRYGSVISYNSTDCGYIEPQYRWYTAPNTDYICSGTTKYQKQYYQVSTDGGQTWSNVTPYQTKVGSVIETSSTDCGYIEPTYRWQKAVSTDYVCVGYNKYYKEYYQVSYDGGTTWENVSPEQTRTSSDIIETNSSDCGYPKAIAMVTVDGQQDWIDITSTDDTIRRSDLERTLTSTQIENITELHVHVNCKHIADGAFQGLTKLYEITNLGINLETIGDNAFNGCTLLEQVDWNVKLKTIGANAFKNTRVENVIITGTVTSIGDGAFSGCSNMLQVVAYSETPPTLSSDSHAFDGSTCKIYVPLSAVDTYKTATGWSKYASRIRFNNKTN